MNNLNNLSLVNTLKFPRVRDKDVIGYKIIIKELTQDNKIANIKETFISNPKSAELVRESHTLKYSKSGIYKLPAGYYLSILDDVELFINDIKIPNSNFKIKEKDNVLVLTNSRIKVSESSKIVFKGNFDYVTTSFKTKYNCSYSINVVTKDDSKIGRHIMV